jgi:hypothetical protein
MVNEDTCLVLLKRLPLVSWLEPQCSLSVSLWFYVSCVVCVLVVLCVVVCVLGDAVRSGCVSGGTSSRVEDTRGEERRGRRARVRQQPSLVHAALP